MQVQKAKSGYKLVKWHYGEEIEIPEDWEYEELTSKIKILSGFSFKSEFFNEEKGMPLIRIRDLSNDITETFYTGDYEEEYIVHEGDLLVGMDGEFKPYLWKGKDALLNQRVCKLTTNNKTLDQKLLYYIIGKELLHYELINVGTTVIHISKSDIEKIVIPYPPIREQQKISYILSNVDVLISSYDDIIKKTKVLKKDLMHQLLTKGIGHTKFKKVKSLFGNYEEIPHEWELCKLKNLCNKIGDGIHSTPNYVDSSDFYFINGNNLINGSIIFFDSTKNVDEDEYLKYKLDLNENTVFLSINGTIGNVAFYNNEKIVLGKSICYINCNEKLNNKFLSYLLKSYYWARYISRELTGTTISNLSLASIRNFPIQLPKKEEQNYIAIILSNVDYNIKELESKKTVLEKLKKGLMQKLFTGQIRVKV